MENRRLPGSATWGAAIGCTSWSVLLTVFFFAYGAPESALKIGVPCMFLSAGFVALMLIALEGVSRTLGFRSRAWMEALWGIIFFFMGVLLVLANTWIGPAMEAAGMAQDGRASVVGVTSFPWWIPIALLVGGTVLLVRVCLGVARATSSSTES